MDFLSEFLAQKSREFLTGTYYKRRPVTNLDGGEAFSYENLDPHTREYKTIIGTLLIEGRTAAIKTRSAIEFKTKQYRPHRRRRHRFHRPYRRSYTL